MMRHPVFRMPAAMALMDRNRGTSQISRSSSLSDWW